MTAPQAIIRSLPVKSIAAVSNIRLSNGHDKESLTQLADSIIAHGLIQPIIVRAADEGEGFEFAIVAGRRRLAATKLAGLEYIPAIVSQTDEAKAYELEIAENIQREQMTLADTARAVRTLMLIHDSAKKVGEIVNKSPAWVSKHLTITSSSFPTVLAELLDRGIVQDLATLLLMKEVHKHDQVGQQRIMRLVEAAHNGTLSRQMAQDTLARLKGPKETPPAPIQVGATRATIVTPAANITNDGAQHLQTFSVELPIAYLSKFEELGGKEWLIGFLSSHD